MKHPSPVELSRALVEGVDDKLRAHLDVCDQCNEDLAMHASITDDVRQLPVNEPDEVHARHLRTSLLAAARTPAPISRPRWVWGLAFAGGLAAAAAATIVVVRAPTESAHVTHATVKPHEGAELVHIEQPDEIVRLSNGTVTVQVAQLDSQERFRVVTGDAEIESRSAAFDVRVSRDHLEAVRVYDGQVEIRSEGAVPRTITAGERWEIELAQPTPAKPVVDTPASDVLEPAPTPEVIATEVPRPVVEKPATRSVPRMQTQEQPPSPPARAKRPIEVLFDEGWSTLMSGDPAGAAPIFERAARSAPTDPLAEDAMFWRASALVRAKSGSAGAALESFLTRYPRSPRVGEASAILGWMLMDQDLDRAEKLFQTAESDRVATVRASATKGLAAVAARRAK